MIGGVRMVYGLVKRECVCTCLTAHDFHYACVVLIVIDFFDARTCPVGATLWFLHFLTAHR